MWITNRIDKSAEVEEYSVECHRARGLQGISIDDITAYHGVSYLNTSGDFKRSVFTHHEDGQFESIYIERVKSVQLPNDSSCQC